MSSWKPISENVFPWPHRHIMVAARHDEGDLEVFLCVCADGGKLFPAGDMCWLEEEGWTPIAFSLDLPPGCIGWLDRPRGQP